MRDAAQIALTPEQYADFKQAERRCTLRALLDNLRHARENRAEWYTWVAEGMPELTPDQYEAVKAKRATRRKSA